MARSSRGGGKKNAGPLIGLAALIAYYIGIYLLLYLSRTREYLADAFSANKVEPRHLASALIKIAYGIVAIEDTEASPKVRWQVPAPPRKPCCSTPITLGPRSFSSTPPTL